MTDLRIAADLIAIIVLPERTGAKPADNRTWGPAGQTECSECGSSERKHLGRGLCTSCYHRRREAMRRMKSADADEGRGE